MLLVETTSQLLDLQVFLLATRGELHKSLASRREIEKRESRTGGKDEPENRVLGALFASC